MTQGENPGSEGTRDAAFGQFYKSSFAELVRRCLWIGVPEAAAPDIVQELMLEIYRRWEDIRSPEAYAHRTVFMRAVGSLGISANVPSRDESDLAYAGKPLTANLPDGVLSLDGEQLVLHALAQLPSIQRSVFALDYDGFTCIEIGAILNLNPVTVRSNLRHAKKRLRAWWNQANRSDEGRTEP
jgi:DNA-directed RNA polymerase specialized sigma24 family protein